MFDNFIKLQLIR